MWKYLDLVRIYTKPKGNECYKYLLVIGLMPDYNTPVVLTSEACSVEDFCNSIHKGTLLFKAFIPRNIEKLQECFGLGIFS